MSHQVEKTVGHLGLVAKQGPQSLSLTKLISDTCNEDCLSFEGLLAVAGSSVRELLVHTDGHIRQCPRCAIIYSAFRSSQLLKQLPRQLHVRLGGLFDSSSEEGATGDPIHTPGRIDLATGEIEACGPGDTFNPQLGTVRVNGVLGIAADMFHLTLLDVPESVHSAEVTLLGKLLSFSRSGEVWEAESRISDLLGMSDVAAAADLFLKYLRGGPSSLLFECKTEGTDVLRFLTDADVIRRIHDYVVPSKYHSDTYIDSSALGFSRNALKRIAQEVDRAFADIEFDTILSNGWPMDFVSRRLSAMRSVHRGIPRPSAVGSEGHKSPRLNGRIRKGSRVLVLTDVSVTGRLQGCLAEIVKNCGGVVVGRGALAVPKSRDSQIEALRSLARVEMDLDVPGAGCTRCSSDTPKMVFNPLASTMTFKKETGRSASEFLFEFPDALEFWQDVDSTDAYQHHYVEGPDHYLSFINTDKMLANKTVCTKWVQRLVHCVKANGYTPEIILVPKRRRGERLARLLSAHLSDSELEIVSVRKTGDLYRLTPSMKRKLAGKRVLVVDSAAGWGRTLDELCILAEDAEATAVGAAVILSRLSERCEEAFNSRLEGGFHRIANIPIRPYKGSKQDCPVCRARESVRQCAEESEMTELMAHFDYIYGPGGGPPRDGKETTDTPEEEASPEYEATHPFLAKCRSRTASGVVLNNLYTSQNNGMAALSLPEINDHGLGWQTRTAMVRHLPYGVLEWSKGYLDRDLETYIDNGEECSVFGSVSEVFANEDQLVWLDDLQKLLSKNPRLSPLKNPAFWNQMTLLSYDIGKRCGVNVYEVEARLNGMLQEHHRDECGEGLRMMQNGLLRGKEIGGIVSAPTADVMSEEITESL